MRNLRSYYSDNLNSFLEASKNEILGIIRSNDISAETKIQQGNTWNEEIDILKDQLASFKEGKIIFEYTIPRMGKRVDIVFLYQNIVFLLEFKCGDKEYRSSSIDQVYDYALDLRNFHKESHNKLLVPIVVSTKAKETTIKINEKERILTPLKCNAENISYTIDRITKEYTEKYFNYQQWENSEYLPTPTIIEAAQALYRGHNVGEITRNDAGAENLSVTSQAINEIIEYSKYYNRKSICFVTGVPGAGKTLVGLNIAIQRSDAAKGEHAVFLSGNYPLVSVLQEALARDRVEQCKNFGEKLSKTDARRDTSAFIQIIHKYRDSFIDNEHIPPEKVVIFDEAQRSWTKEQISMFMKTKKGISEFDYSEPEFLISTMNRHKDWAMIICLVGGGQEINTGEAGLPEWFDALRKTFREWDVYVTPQLNDEEYRRNYKWVEMIRELRIMEEKSLHLSTSIRSFRTPNLAAFVKSLLDLDHEKAEQLHDLIKDAYPILFTRNIKRAKKWVRERSQGTTRYGMLASSGGLRLKPEGIFVKNKINVANWFLNGKEDVRSSYFLEDVVTEFDIQGLEVDYSIVCWDADFRLMNNQWNYFSFKGCKWTSIKTEERQLYLKNAYRVLLTRARQGMVIFIPEGDDRDKSRAKVFYSELVDYFKRIGINEL